MSYGDRHPMFAPGASGASALRAPSAGTTAGALRAPAGGAPREGLRAPGHDEAPGSHRRRVDEPAVDERLIMPETGYEVVDGRVMLAPPADEPHGALHFDLTHILAAYVAQDFRGAVDMLTRTSQTSDHAPDASIYPRERDEVTGGRKLEHLAFEILSEQALSVVTLRAKKYVARGVRRVFCIDVGKKKVLEWSPERGRWDELAPGATIEDRCFVRPLPVRALVDAALVDDTVAQGLLARKNPVIEEALDQARSEGAAQGKAEGKAEGQAEGKAEGKAEGMAEGKAEGMAEAVLQVLTRRKIALTDEEREHIRTCKDTAKLARWLTRSLDAATARDVLGRRRR